MMRILYKLEDQNSSRDRWVVPNREETYSGLVKLTNVMKYFVEATGGNTPILIKDVFECKGFADDILYAVNVNGNKKIVTDEHPEMWYNAFSALSQAVNANLHIVPNNNYQFYLF